MDFVLVNFSATSITLLLLLLLVLLLLLEIVKRNLGSTKVLNTVLVICFDRNYFILTFLPTLKLKKRTYLLYGIILTE